jgi:RIO kinase 1
MNQWAAREFWVLDRLFHAGARVPTPARHADHMFTARLLGENLTPAPLLKDCILEHPQRTFDSIIEQVFLLYRSFVIHGDLSAFNVLMFRDEPWLIDLPQAIDFASRPSRRQVLEEGRLILLRDIKNIVDYFERFGIRADTESLCGECTSQVGLQDRFDPQQLRH